MTEQARIEALARDMIQRGEFNYLLNPGEGTRIDREYQDDRRLRYSIRDIPTFDGKGDSLPHTHMKVITDTVNMPSIYIQQRIQANFSDATQ